MTFDAAAPTPLIEIQQWFASIITRPIDIDSKMEPISPSGQSMEDEASLYISPSPTLLPHRRIELYNQQYWWRLLSIMQDSFPLVTRLFGYIDFNQMIAIPYLMKYPPKHWSLILLGENLPRWIEEEYREKDKPLIFNAAKLDWAHNHSFISQEGPAMGDNTPNLLEQRMTLQPHLHLFEHPYDLFEFRIEFLKEKPEYWLDHDFPLLPHNPCYFVLFRNVINDVQVEPITHGEYQLLYKFINGLSIDELCQWLETCDPSSPLYIEASTHLQNWIQRWIGHRWLCPWAERE